MHSLLIHSLEDMKKKGTIEIPEEEEEQKPPKPELHMAEDACWTCRYKPCEFSNIEGELVSFVTGAQQKKGFVMWPNNVARKKLYGEASYLLEGPLGSGNRKPLPPCVVAGIRAYFPSPNNEYMGYHSE